MFELGTTAALCAGLEEARDQLTAIARRVEDAVDRAPRRDPGGWDGPAAAAYQHALDRLGRELAAAEGLLRSAIDLLGAALSELGARA